MWRGWKVPDEGSRKRFQWTDFIKTGSSRKLKVLDEVPEKVSKSSTRRVEDSKWSFSNRFQWKTAGFSGLQLFGLLKRACLERNWKTSSWRKKHRQPRVRRWRWAYGVPAPAWRHLERPGWKRHVFWNKSELGPHHSSTRWVNSCMVLGWGIVSRNENRRRGTRRSVWVLGGEEISAGALQGAWKQTGCRTLGDGVDERLIISSWLLLIASILESLEIRPHHTSNISTIHYYNINQAKVFDTC